MVRKTKEEFLEQANKIHNCKYNYDKLVYTETNNKVTITCKIHGDFEQLAYNHLRGRGCRKCSNDKQRIIPEEFIKKANKIHNNLYNYDKVVYTGSLNKITITCKIHGDFEQTSSNHLSGNGCRKCSTNKQRNTLEEFIIKANKIHNNLYSYDKVVYIDYKTKVTIICKTHGDFEQTPANHISGQNCNKCVGTIRFTTEQFIEQSNKIHNCAYSYDKVNYINNKTKVTITCKVHGDFEQTPKNHLKGNSCGKCAGNIKNTTEQFIEQSNSVHNGIYCYDKVVYIGNKTQVTITCKIHGDFKQSPDTHLKGGGCTKCNRIGYSKKAISWLRYIENTQQISIQHAENGGEFLILGTRRKADGYYKETSTIYEFYGDYWHGNPKRFSSNEYNTIAKCSYGELYQNTLKREQQIRDLGYNLVTIWESDWDKQEKLLTT